MNIYLFVVHPHAHFLKSTKGQLLNTLGTFRLGFLGVWPPCDLQKGHSKMPLVHSSDLKKVTGTGTNCAKE